MAPATEMTSKSDQASELVSSRAQVDKTESSQGLSSSGLDTGQAGGQWANLEVSVEEEAFGREHKEIYWLSFSHTGLRLPKGPSGRKLH